MRYAILLVPLLAVLAACDGGGEPQPTPTPSPAVARPSPTPEPTVAPTPTPEPVETLAFIRDGDIRLINADGSGEQRLTTLGNVQEFSWVSATELDIVSGEDRSGHLLLDLDGSVRELPFPAGGSWSRDGRLYLAVVSEGEIGIFNRDGQETARLSVGPSMDECGSVPQGTGEPRLAMGSPGFSSDGRRVLISVNCWQDRGAYNQYGRIYEVSMDGQINQALPAPERINLRGGGVPRFSPDGAHFAQTSIDGLSLCPWGRDLIVVDAAGETSGGLSNPIAELNHPLAPAETVGGVTGFDWSPGSDAVVATFEVSPCDPAQPLGEPVGGLYILKLDGSPEEKLLQGLTHSPAWSPSGSFVAHVAGRFFGERTDPPIVRLLDLTTRQVVDLTEGESPAWQPQP